jgi:hypothetical protein
VTIINPTAIAANATATALLVIALPTHLNRLITVAPTGGTGTYTYSYDNGGSYIKQHVDCQ